MTRMNRTAMAITSAFALLLGGVILATQVSAAEEPRDAANANTPELFVRPAKQHGQFDLELRLPDKATGPRMTVEAGKWGTLEVALDGTTQLTFRARVNEDKQQVRVSGQVTVAVTGGFRQWIAEDEPWPVGEWKLFKAHLDDAAKPAARTEDTLDQLIRGGRVVEGKPLALGGGLALSCFCQAQAAPPTPEKATPLIVGVRVANTGEEDVEFQPAELNLMLQWGEAPMRDVGIHVITAARRQPPLVLKPGEKWTWTGDDARLNYVKYGDNPVYLSFEGAGYVPGQFLRSAELKSKADRIAFAARYDAFYPDSPPCEPVVCRLTEIGGTKEDIEEPIALSLVTANAAWETPQPGGERELEDIIVNVTNRTGKDIGFWVDCDSFVMKDAAGRTMDLGAERFGTGKARSLHLGPGQTGSYRHTATLKLPRGRKLPSVWLVGPSNAYHISDDLAPGEYTLQLVYQCHQTKLGDTSVWAGKAVSSELKITVKPGPAAADLR